MSTSTPPRKRNNNFVLILATIMGLLLIMLNLDRPQKPEVKAEAPIARTVPAPLNAREHIDMLARDYHAYHQRFPDRFWLTGMEGPEGHMQAVETWTTHTRELLAQSADVAPLARELYDQFRTFQVTEFRNGVTVKYGKIADLMMPNEGILEVVVVPVREAQRYQHEFPSLLYYRPNWRAVSVVGIETPDTFRAALIYHELGHAKRHWDGAASATADSDSDIFIAEEMEMHELENDVLDHVTQGKVKALFAAIRSRVPNPQDLESVYLAVTAEDLIAFDTITQIDTAGTAMAGIYLAQFQLGLGIDTINATNMPDAQASKIDLYRWSTGRPSRMMRHAVAQAN